MTRRRRRAVFLVASSAHFAIGAFVSPVGAATVASWVAPVSGSWTQGARWSTAPSFPGNGSPPGTTYDVVVNAVGSPYTLTLNSSHVVDSLRLDSPDATFIHAGSLSVVGPLTLARGLYRQTAGSLTTPSVVLEPGATYVGDFGTLSAGTIAVAGGATFGTTASMISGWTLRDARVEVANGGTASFRFGEFDNVTLAGRVAAGGITVRNGLRLDDALLDVNGRVTYEGGGTVSGPGEILLTGGGGVVHASGGTLTIGPDVRVRLTGNQGQIGAEGQGLVNTGTITAAPGRLTIAGNDWANNGTFEVNNGVVELTGTVRTANLGTIIRTPGVGSLMLGGELLAGTLNNAGQTLDLARTGELILRSAVINGGTISSSDGSRMRIASSGRLVGVTLATELHHASSIDRLTVTDSLTLAPGGRVRLGGGAGLVATNSVAFVGTGEIVVDGERLSTASTTIGGHDSTIGPGITIRTQDPGTAATVTEVIARTNDGSILQQGNNMSLRMAHPSWTNNAMIRADAGSLTLANSWTNNGTVSVSGVSTLTLAGTWSNPGTITAHGATVRLNTAGSGMERVTLDGGTLVLAGSFTTAQTRQINQTNTALHVRSALDNTGQAIVMGQHHTVIALSAGGRINGGTIGATAGQELQANGGTLSGVTLGAPVLHVSNLSLQTIDLVNNATIRHVPDGTFTGGVTLNGTWTNNGTIDVTGGHIALRGTAGRVGRLEVTRGLLFVGVPLTTAQVEQVRFDDVCFVELQSAIDNAGEVFTIAPNVYWRFVSGRFNGGTISAAAGAPAIDVLGTGFVFDGVTVDAPAAINVYGNVRARIVNGLTLNGATITLGAASNGNGWLTFDGTQTVAGTGRIELLRFDSGIEALAGTVTLGGGITVTNLVAPGGGGTISAGTLATIVNQGAVVAQGAERRIQLTGNFVNNGLAEATDGATLLAHAATLGNAGTLRTRGGGVMSVAGALVNTGIVDVGGTVVVDYSGTSPLASWAAQLAAGYNGGAWDGPGVNSSVAAVTPGFGVGIAEAADVFATFPHTIGAASVDSTSLVLRLARYGDANLDGTVNLQDFNRLAANFGQSNRVWSHGDFNYDGVVSLPDFNRLAGNFGFSAGPDGVVDPADWANLAAAVPEPALPMTALVAALSFAIEGRPRRCR